MRHPLLLLCALLVALSTSADAQRETPSTASTPTQWKEAAAGYQFSFPRDHAAHPDYKLEWWYYTGNVSTADGHRFGYQVTFFRVGVDRTPSNPSAWAIRDLYMTHAAVSDLTAGVYEFDERLSRGGPGIAGAREDRFEVWNEDWRAARDDQGRHTMRLQHPRFTLDLQLDEGKPPVINGRDGISQKGSAAGNASHYYSLTRMPTRGTITMRGTAYEVRGETWMDREFGTTFLEPGQQGWDWFSLQLDGGTELMIYRLRRGDGSRDTHSSGTWVAADGTATMLANEDFELLPEGDPFTSPRSGATYPTRWRIRVPRLALDLAVTTPLRDQELYMPHSSGVAYWEGAIAVSGRVGARDVQGRGYLEMTGYKGSMGRVLSSP